MPSRDRFPRCSFPIAFLYDITVSETFPTAGGFHGQAAVCLKLKAQNNDSFSVWLPILIRFGPSHTIGSAGFLEGCIQEPFALQRSPLNQLLKMVFVTDRVCFDEILFQALDVCHLRSLNLTKVATHTENVSGCLSLDFESTPGESPRLKGLALKPRHQQEAKGPENFRQTVFISVVPMASLELLAFKCLVGFFLYLAHSELSF